MRAKRRITRLRADRRALAGAALLLFAVTGCTGGAEATPVPTPTHLGLETIAPGETGTNGIEHLSGADALTESLDAVARADGVQFAFSYVDATGTLEVDYSGRRGAASATVVTADGELQLLMLDGSGYLRGSGDLAARYGASAEYTCRELGSGAFGDSAFADFGDVLDLQHLVRAVTSGLTIRRGALNEGQPPTVDLVLETESGAVGILIVTASGEPLPVRMALSDETASATLDVTGWDAVQLEAPVTC